MFLEKKDSHVVTKYISDYLYKCGVSNRAEILKLANYLKSYVSELFRLHPFFYSTYLLPKKDIITGNAHTA